MPRPLQRPFLQCPPFFPRRRWVGCTPFAFSPKPSWVRQSPWALRSFPGCHFRRSVLPRPFSGPGPFQRTIASRQGKIPSPRVQVSKELLGPLFSLEWALRSRCSCLACPQSPTPPRVFCLTPELPRSCFPPDSAWELRKKRNKVLFPRGN